MGINYMTDKSNIYKQAKDHSKEIHYNDDKEQGFLLGVSWTIEALKINISENCPYNIDSGTKQYLRNLSLKDVKNFIKNAEEINENSKV